MDKTIELVNAIKDIQAMPTVIVKVLNLMKKPTVSMKELSDIVMYDQSLTIKLFSSCKFSILRFLATNQLFKYSTFSFRNG